MAKESRKQEPRILPLNEEVREKTEKQLKEENQISSCFPNLYFVAMFPAFLYLKVPPYKNKKGRIVKKERNINISEAWLLSYLCDQHRGLSARPDLQRNGGWFYHKEDKLEKEAKIPKGSQLRLLRTLEHMGLLQMKRIGWPPKRHIRLEIMKVNELAEKAQPIQSK